MSIYNFEKIMSKKHMVIAIDGPAASGKGTVAKMVAKYFGMDYLDTGSIYRAVGYKLISEGISPEDKDAAVMVAKNITPDDIANPHLYDEGIGSAASIVSAIPEVRDALFNFQKNFAKSPNGAVLDGRDIGTVICPDADFKFFITANIETRAKRRFKQLQNQQNSIIYESVLDDLKRRDERDSQRSIAPLKKADDAIFIDTTDMNADEVFKKVLSLIERSNVAKAQNAL